MNKYSNNNIWAKNNILLHDLNKKHPIHVELELTRYCNHKCVFCYSNGDKSGDIKELQRKIVFPYSRLRTLIEELKELKVKSISFTGTGEPLLYNQLHLVINKIIDSGMEVGITTNLSKLLTREQVDALDKCSWIRISLNASNPDDYIKIHQPLDDSSFNNVIKNIRKLDINLPKCISYVICKQNENKILQMVNLAANLDVNSIYIRPEIGFNRNNSTYSDTVLEQLKECKKMQSDTFYVDSGVDRFNDCKIIGSTPCGVSDYLCFISSFGDVFPCCVTHYDMKYSYGNILDNKFIDIWNKRKKVDMKDCPPCRHTNENICLDLLRKETINNFI